MLFLIGTMSFLCVALGIYPACYMARHFGFVDSPDTRKHHKSPTPPVGGLVIVLAFIAIFTIWGASLHEYWPLFSGLFLLTGIGAWDDYTHAPPWPKFTAQILAAAIIVVFGGVKIVHLGNIFGLGALGLNIFAVPFSITAIVLFINAVNLMDGLDGLAGGYAFSVCFALLSMAFINNFASVYIPLTILCGGLAGFLIHNMRSPFTPAARVFLGDAGSLSLGLLLAWFAIRMGQVDMGEMIHPIVIAWFLAIPIMDTCAQFYRRVKEGRSPFSPDRGHFHHQFIDAGLSVSQTVWCLLIGINVLGIGAYIAARLGVPDVVLTLLWIGTLFTHLALSRDVGVYTKMIRRILKVSS